MNAADREKADLQGLMYIRCAMCGTWMDVKPGDATGVSHSLCPDCFDAEMKRLDQEDEKG